MRISILFCCVLALLTGCANTQNSTVGRNAQTSMSVPDRLLGIWTLKIEDLQHQVVTTMTIRFVEKKANSCLGGNWKQIVVDSHNTSDKHFFPVDQPLSYELVNNELIIGRNGICDAYLHLSGELIDSKASGRYVQFGWGSKLSGYFYLSRDNK